MSDQKRIGIFAVVALILLIGAIISARIDSSKPILNQIVQQIVSPRETVSNLINNPSLESHSISNTPSWIKDLTKPSASSSTTTITSISWEEAVKTGVFVIGCDIATTTVTLKDISDKTASVSFEYAKCADKGVTPDSYKIAEDKKIVGGSRTIAYYWLLGDKKPEDIIGSLINSLPSPYERAHCLITAQIDPLHKANPKYPRYEIVPDDALNTLNNKVHPNEIPFLCGDFGLNEQPHFFQKVGNALLFIITGQDVPPFNPDSFQS